MKIYGRRSRRKILKSLLLLIYYMENMTEKEIKKYEGYHAVDFYEILLSTKGQKKPKFADYFIKKLEEYADEYDNDELLLSLYINEVIDKNYKFI
jgi:hypothetical protein